MAKKGSWVDHFWEMLTVNLGAKLISIIIAIVLWVVVLGSRNVEVTKDIPLELVAPSDLVPANEIPDHISFRLSGPKAFLRAILDRREDPIRVNLAGAKAGLVTYRFFSDNIRVPIGVKVLSVLPASIPIRLEAVKRRDVPVKLDLRGALPEGFRMRKAAVVPPVVRIKGAESRVDSITEITTMPLDISNLRQGLEREVGLDLSRAGVLVDGQLPKAQLDVEPLSANFKIKGIDVRVLSSYKAKVDDRTVTVFVRAETNDLRHLDRNVVFAIIDLTKKPKGKYKVPIQVRLPEGVGLVKVTPDQTTVTLY